MDNFNYSADSTGKKNPITEESNSLDKRIEFLERRVLICQARVIKEKDDASLLVRRLEREAKSLEEIKREWIKKKNLEEERIRVEKNELMTAHRHAIDDLRLKYEKERENKLRPLRALIIEEEKEIREWQKKRSEASIRTRTEEAEIKARFQVRINALLKDEQSVCRRGVVGQKRLLSAPNVFSIALERNQSVGMKKRAYSRRF